MRMAPGATQESVEAGLDTITRHLDDENRGRAGNAASSNNASKSDKTRRVQFASRRQRSTVPRALKPVLLGFYGRAHPA